MSNGDDNDDAIRNCALEVCCGEDGRQVRAIEKQVRHAMPELSPEQAHMVAVWLSENYDLAPKGSLYAFKKEVARLARGAAYTEKE